ncbi:RapZ C-terminal domain-containing protein [Streptomyces sp. NBC_00691]|uniref:RapZ C-terminal domain-containing protein n=1 Tax=Streptomyces sp. NBC_00691 TaxID=2903671 RepID=UPI002E30F501|nr:RNase adapter RapZ [Streptomyces sp. NBC_00691]
MQTTHLPGRGLVAAVVSSIGIRHDGALSLADTGLYLDLSRVVRNPADDPTMRFRTGLDDDVYAHVLKTPGALTLINRTAVQLRALADEMPAGRLARLTVACKGGRHRSVAAAETVGCLVWEAWGGAYGVDIEHHHIDHPVLTSPTPA